MPIKETYKKHLRQGDCNAPLSFLPARNNRLIFASLQREGYTSRKASTKQVLDVTAPESMTMTA